ncbi:MULTISPECIES: acyl carrier protein phosphodiesterase [unclassified Leeuwenhoekiella]|uniref:acyl carrier protein phosphodiesterase n=1 Tax=unclassified Leeuwenhoekiella TaxID=2615029 RepID=UPI000C416AD5|nr:MULTISPECIES: acyl carrier protein phosphodiesterase [unclassified Leeuwenhoekiella]MAW93823.1 ACP phosphodiesterase [Leeuwenhoekiella sp.]MBA82230.1 ACP phosphodiesterase [Leeuwenhoekiella sp.]|tara:strand:- start:5337 stop:5948 length:612 start_codon:yes stop_codon:yes gene_type:complete
MNFLAHIYLSGDDELVTLGNFMADGIKGKQYKEFGPRLKKGILLHRSIDTFTDGHPIVRQSTRRLHAKYSHYSGVIVDILYDHFLAKNWHTYSDVPLADYIEEFYDSLDRHYDLLTNSIQHMIPHMIADNWLLSYAKISGIATVLYNMNRRTRNRSGMDRAVEDLQEHYTDFENEFTSFFEELRTFSAQRLSELNAEFPDTNT